MMSVTWAQMMQGEKSMCITSVCVCREEERKQMWQMLTAGESI